MSGDSPFGRFLVDPLGTLSRLSVLTEHFVIAHLPVLVAVGLVLAALTVTLRRVVGDWRHARLAEEARGGQIQAPPIAEAAAAAALWANVVGLLRPRGRRVVFGQPHVAVEYCWDGPDLRIQIWVPGPVPAGLVARAVEAAWPSARTTITESSAPLPADAASTGG